MKRPPYELRGKVIISWSITCQRHEDCHKTRYVVPAHTAAFGLEEVVAYLHAWRLLHVEPGARHSLKRPNKEQVAELMAVEENHAVYAQTVAWFEEHVPG